MITEFIWDFDGMLFDTYPHTTAAFCEYLRRAGIAFDEKEVFAKLKVSIREAFAYYNVSSDGVREFYEIEDDLDFLPRGVPYENIPEILKFISDSGARNYLYTHRDKVALQYLRMYSLEKLFTDFITAENGFPLKPAPDALMWLADKHSLNKENCLMLGDRVIDCMSGINCGMKALLFDELGMLKDTGSYTYYVPTTADLFEKVKILLEEI